MDGRTRTKQQTLGTGKGSTRAWGGDLCELLSVQESDNVPHLRRKATDDGACQMYYACRVLGRMRDTVILIHGPRGCAQTLNLYTGFHDGFRMQGKAMDHPKRVECSNLGENDVVFGGADRLRQAILDTDRRYHPSFIPIMETCVPGMIGDDMDAVAADVQREVKAKLMVFHVPGFRAVNPADGAEIVHGKLVREVMEQPKEVQRDCVNIWLTVSDPRFTRGNHDCDELLRLLKELGLTGKFFLGGASIEDVRRAPEAVLNIPYQPAQTQGLFREMEERFGAACTTQERPLGVEMTKRWLRAIGQKLRLENEAEALIEREMARIGPQLEQYRKRLEGKTVALHAGHGYTVPLLWLVGVELGMVPTYVGIARYDSYLYEGLREIQEYLDTSSLKIVINAGKFEEEVIISKVTKPDVYIAHFDYMPRMFTYMQPTVLGSGYEHAGPHLGFNGAVNFAREVVWAIENPFARKVVPYAGLRPYSSQAWLEGSPLLAGVTLESITR